MLQNISLTIRRAVQRYLHYMLQEFVDDGVRIHQTAGSGSRHVHRSRSVVRITGPDRTIKPRPQQSVRQSARSPLRFTVTQL